MFGNIAQLMQQASQIKEKVKDAQHRLESTVVTGEAGGGMVEVSIRGTLDVHSVVISPQLAASGDAQMMQTLTQAAIKEALDKIKVSLKNEFSNVTGGMSLPGFN